IRPNRPMTWRSKSTFSSLAPVGSSMAAELRLGTTPQDRNRATTPAMTSRARALGSIRRSSADVLVSRGDGGRGWVGKGGTRSNFGRRGDALLETSEIADE